MKSPASTPPSKKSHETKGNNITDFITVDNILDGNASFAPMDSPTNCINIVLSDNTHGGSRENDSSQEKFESEWTSDQVAKFVLNEMVDLEKFARGIRENNTRKPFPSFCTSDNLRLHDAYTSLSQEKKLQFMYVMDQLEKLMGSTINELPPEAHTK